MATSVSFNGSTYSVPASGERAWGASLSAYLVAIASGALSKAGGSFTLTSADIDWGATYGHKSVKFASRNTPATTGIFRLGNDEAVSWRNAANSADLALKVNASNALQFNGSSLLAAGAASIVNADVSASAAIAYSKLEALTASKALVSDGSGFVSASSVTSTELGYVSGVTSAIQTQIDGKQAADSDLTAVAGLSSTGLIARTGSGTAAVRALTAGSSKLAVSNGDGVSGNPTVDVTEANLTHDNIGGTLGIAKGGTGQTTAAAAFKALAAYSAKGDTVGYDGSAAGRLAIGADGTVLTADAASTYGFKWGTALTNPMTAAQDVIVGGSAGAATRLPTTSLGDVTAQAGSATATMTIATPCVVTYTSHGFITGDKVYFTTSGALPTGVTASTTYYVIKVDANTFNLATSLSNALAGTKVATSGSQSGTHTVFYGGLVLTATTLRGGYAGASPGAGYIGEKLTSSGAGSTITTNTASAVTSLSLTPGVWLLTGTVLYNGVTNAPSAWEWTDLAINASSADTASGTNGIDRVEVRPQAPQAGSYTAAQLPNVYVNISSTTTYYLNQKTKFTTAGTVTIPAYALQAVRIA